MAGNDLLIASIVPDGGNVVVAGRERGGNGDNGERPRRGEIAADGETLSLGGDREQIKPGVYYNQKTVPILRGFVSHLTDEAEIAHYNNVISELSRNLYVDDETKIAYEATSDRIVELSSEAVAIRVETFYRDQLQKSISIFDGYLESASTSAHTEERLTQEKALLVYAEYLLAQNQVNSIHDNRHAEGHAFDLDEALSRLQVTDEQRVRLHQALHGMTSFADFSYIQRAHKMVTALEDYTPPDFSSPLELNTVYVNENLARSNAQIEGAHRLMIDALDKIAAQNDEQGPSVNLNESPLTTWSGQVEERLGRSIESKDYINTLIGTEKGQTKLFVLHENHKVKHLIQNMSHRAPVRRRGDGEETLQAVEAAEINLFAGVYQGELHSGKTYKPGESHPKEFFERVIDVKVWSVSLNSPDKIANFIDQLNAAEAVATNGAEITGLAAGGFNIDMDPSQVNGEAFRVPVLNHEGKPNFVVVDRDTLLEMASVAKVSKASYARLAAVDPRYKVNSQTERWEVFKPPLSEQRTTPDNWVNEERGFILAEGLSRQRVEALKATGDEVDSFVADQLEQAFHNYTTQFNEFQMNYCRPSQYRNLAVARLGRRGFSEIAPDFESQLEREMNTVALEYMSRWNAFRTVTERMLILNSDADAIVDIEQQLKSFLANIDYELQIVAVAGSSANRENEVRATLNPFMRTTLPPTTNGRLLENAYAEASRGYNDVFPDGRKDYEAVSLTVDALLAESLPLMRLSNASLNEFQDKEYRSDAEAFQAGHNLINNAKVLGAKQVIAKLKEFKDGGDESLEGIYARNVDFLQAMDRQVEAGYPENDGARRLLEQTRLEAEDLLGRDLTHEEINRFLDNHPNTIDARKFAVSALLRASEYSRGFRDITSVLNELTIGADRLGDLTQDELIEYANMVNASVRALSSIDVSRPREFEQMIPHRSGGGSNPLSIAQEHPGEPILQSMAIAYENALNESVDTLAVGKRIREISENIKI